MKVIAEAGMLVRPTYTVKHYGQHGRRDDRFSLFRLQKLFPWIRVT
jgi:hypothetical protein